MEPFVRRFVRASLVWLGVGVLIGVSMAFWPAEALVYRPAHMHANLLGFVSMMIFGVAYHVMPRFAGRPLPSRTLASAHLVLANLGLALLVGGWTARPWWPGAAAPALALGAALSAAGAALFIYNIWHTVAPAPALTPLVRSAPSTPASPGRPVPATAAPSSAGSLS